MKALGTFPWPLSLTRWCLGVQWTVVAFSKLVLETFKAVGESDLVVEAWCKVDSKPEPA